LHAISNGEARQKIGMIAVSFYSLLGALLKLVR
jgi:hypothetical protein